MFRAARKYFVIITLVLFIVNWGWASMLRGIHFRQNITSREAEPSQALRLDSDSLPYPFHDRYGDPYSTHNYDRDLFLHDPSNIERKLEYDPDERYYSIDEKMGNLFYRSPS
mgnify:CR=1 FL=1